MSLVISTAYTAYIDAMNENATLRKRVAELEERAEVAERARDERGEKLAEAYTQLSLLKSGNAYAQVRADLDAALNELHKICPHTVLFGLGLGCTICNCIFQIEKHAR